MDSKMKIRARSVLNFRKGTKITTNTGKILKFVENLVVGKKITHFLFEVDGKFVSFKMGTFPHLNAMNLPQYKRDEIGSINILTHEFLLLQLREIKKLKIVDSSFHKKVA